MNPFEEIVLRNQLFLESLSVIRECLEREDDLLMETIFSELQKKQSMRLLKEMEATQELLSVFEIVAQFESIVSQYIDQVITSSMASDDSFTNHLKNDLKENAERWRFDDKLDLFRDVIEPTLLGDIKNLYKFRNWIAHGKRFKKPASFTLLQAKERLEKFLLGASIITQPSDD